ncbi:LysR family transcriptional regulator [Herbaspirillum huttiense]|uniref:LysR family transcriptional regulator n=1 Tax=Herbaspirillum huttiense TaxID=863372 RepID=UPI001067123F|nr:LysR family transcriptional regulator [Herbaspirillum huttiense]QBP76620.1 LysR family transcriptional regulator [Herbaspirillum huttiense]
MNLRFVEAFHWAASLKSITRAAEKLHITQSTMSSRIASLEEELGVVLLDRREKQFRLTVAGQRFQRLAVKLLDMQRQIRQELGGNSAGPLLLRIGSIESVVHSWLPAWLQEIRSRYPDFALELTVETSPVLTEQIRRGAQDLVFTSTVGSDTAVRSRLMTPMEMVFVGHRERFGTRSHTLDELAAHDLITFQRGSQPHQGVLQLCQEWGVIEPRVHAISSISAMVQLVEGGFGVATLPRASVRELTRRLPLRILRCEAMLPPLQIHASYREDPSSSLAELVLDSALEHARRTQGKGRTAEK